MPPKGHALTQLPGRAAPKEPFLSAYVGRDGRADRVVTT